MIGFVTIDLSKDWMDAQFAVNTEKGIALERMARTKSQCRQIVKRAKREGVTELHVAMEATGSLWQEVAECFHKAGARVYVVNPARIKAQRRVSGKRSKTDRIDAGVILAFLRANIHELHVWSPPRPIVIRLQELVRYRETLVGHRTALKGILTTRTLEELRISIRHQISKLNKEIKALEKLIRSTIQSDPILHQQFHSADSVPGVDLINSAIVIAECRAFCEIRDPRQATAFAGLDVVQEESGVRRGRSKISKQGSRLLRRAMVNAAASAVQRPGVFRDFYLRLRERGLKRKQALTAAARKLLEVLVAVVVKNTVFDKTRHKAAA